jgi:hypothetical protein
VDLLTVLRVLARRWYLTLLGLLVTVGATLGFASNLTATYETTSSAVLLAPRVNGDARPGAGGSNPLTQFAGYLETTARILTQVASGIAMAERLNGGGATGTFTITSNGPIITVVANGHSAEEARRTAAVVVDVIRTELAARQDSYGSSKNDRIRADILVAPDTAVRKLGSLIRVLGAATIIGFALTVILVLRVDRVLEARKRPREGKGLRGGVISDQSRRLPGSGMPEAFVASSMSPSGTMSQPGTVASSGEHRPMSDRHAQLPRPARSRPSSSDLLGDWK